MNIANGPALMVGVVMGLVMLVNCNAEKKMQANAYETQKAKVNADILVLELALDRYKLDNFQYPNAKQGLVALVTKPEAPPAPQAYKEGGYLDALPEDPWGNGYVYTIPGEHGRFDILSYGQDGKPGGSGENRDLGNWMFD